MFLYGLLEFFALKWVLFIAVSPLLAKLIIKNISSRRRAHRFSYLAFYYR